eukprot:12278205-Heterocapsa_arctica.AAC.1
MPTAHASVPVEVFSTWTPHVAALRAVAPSRRKGDAAVCRDPEETTRCLWLCERQLSSRCWHRGGGPERRGHRRRG